MLSPKYKIGSYVLAENKLLRIVGWDTSVRLGISYLVESHGYEGFNTNDWSLTEFDFKTRWLKINIDRSMLIIGNRYVWFLESELKLSYQVLCDELDIIMWKITREIYGE